MFAACTSHWSAANPLPDLAGWSAVDDPEERLARALTELYAFYWRTEPMMDNLHRDEATMPLVRERFSSFRSYLAAARETLMARRPPSRPRQAAIGHALAYPTWRSLAREQGLDDAQAADLMCRLVAVS